MTAQFDRDCNRQIKADNSLLRWMLLLTLAGHPLAVSADDWFRWRGPQLNGVSAEVDWDHRRIADRNSQRWQRNVGIGFSSVVTKSGLLLTSGHQDGSDTVHCIDAAGGDIVWQFSYPSPLDAREFDGGPTSTPTIDDDRVYALSREGDLFCFDARSGQIIWRKQIVDLAGVRVPGWGFSASPLVVGDTLLINAGDAGLALNKLTGNLLWKSADKDCGYGTPTLMKQNEQTIAIIPSGRSYVAVDVETGREQWRQRWLTSFGCNAADPIIDSGRVFLSSGYNRGAALLAVRGAAPAILWKNKSMRNQISSSILIDGYLYGVDGDIDDQTSLNCVDLETGEIRWSDSEINPGAIAAAGDRLIVLSKSGELTIAQVSAKGLQVLVSRKVLQAKCWTTPVLSNHRIFCRDASGELVCIDVSPEK